MSVTDQQKRKLMFDLKLLKRKDSLKWDDTIKQLKDMSKGGSGGIDANGNSIRSIKYRNWNDQDFERVLEKVDLAAEENKISDSTAKETLNQTTDQFSYEKDSDDFVIIEGVKCLIVKKCDEKIKLKYENYIDSRIGNLLKTDAIKERKQNCIDPYGLVSKKDSKDLIEPSMKIAVVTSAWKTHDYIEQFLDSIENNTMHPRLVLIGIDACKETENALDHILKKNNYSFAIKSYFSKENVGTYNIRNNLNDLVFDEHDCDAIICMDSDDMFHHEYIRCTHDALIKNADSVIAPNIMFNFKQDSGDKEFILKYCNAVNSFSKQTWKNVGYYLPIKAGADTEWVYRCMKLKQKIFVSDSLLYYRRMHEKQLTKIFPVVKGNIERIKSNNISQSNLILKPSLRKICFENKDQKFISIEGIKTEIIGRYNNKIKVIPNYCYDQIIGDISKTDAVKEKKQNCIDPYGLVSRKNEKILLKSQEDFAIVTSAWRTYGYIEQFLNSIENNTMHPTVVLIGVDACEKTKESLKTIQKNKKYSFEIKAYYSNENVGTYNIRNNLNDLAFNDYKCEFVIHVDSDDMLHKDYIRITHDTLMNYKNCVLTLSLLYNFYNLNGKKYSIAKYDCEVNSFNKHVWKKVGYYLPYRISSDREWLYRALKLKIDINTNKSLIYYRRIHENQLTQDKNYNSNPQKIECHKFAYGNLILKPNLKKINFENLVLDE
jgi:cellulose synthase/poly-beta-1,6-N-acetylglucosamine synthase-like glycosyltransferase